MILDYFDKSDEGWKESGTPSHMFPVVCLSYAVISLDLGQQEKGKTLMIWVVSSSHTSKVSLVRKLHYAVLIRPFLRAPFLPAGCVERLAFEKSTQSSTHFAEFLRVKWALSIYGLSEKRGKKPSVTCQVGIVPGISLALSRAKRWH